MKTLILGGGFGGIAAATTLRRLDPGHEVVIVDRGESFVMGFRKLWELAGLEGGLDAGRRPRRRLDRHGIRFVRADVLSIDPDRRRVETTDGRLDGDVLIVALGAEPRSDLVPGLTEHGTNLYDPAEIPGAALRVASLERGRVVVSVAGLPYKCPPAPYEAVMLLHERFGLAGVRSAIDLTFTTFQPALLPNAGSDGAAWIGARFEERGIAHRVAWPIERVEEGRLVSRDGTLPFDVALVVPPHRPPRVVLDSGLTEGGDWIPVNRETLATGSEGVFAIGDCASLPLDGGGALPKAGVMAEAQGTRVAQAIAARLLGRPEPAPYDGMGACFVELGRGEAALLQGDFFAEGGPVVRILGAGPEHAEAMRRFESDRLAAWFGD